MNKICGIYMVTTPDGIYIGQSRDIRSRWSVLRCRKRPTELLYQSIQRNSVASLKFEILHELPNDVDQSILDTYEVLYISQHKECGFILFNQQKGGKWGGGNTLSIETREKIRRKLAGKKHTQERCKNMSIALKGRAPNSGSFKKKGQ